MAKQDSKHYKKAVKKAVKKVKSVSESGKTADIADIIISYYHDFGDDFLNLVKKEKVLLDYSSIYRMDLIFKSIFEKLNQIKSRTPSSKYDNLEHFLYEYQFLIVPKIRIQNSLDNYQCWNVSRDLALIEIAAEIYNKLTHINNYIAKLDKDQSSSIEVQYLQGDIKNLHEQGVIVLKEVLRRNPPKSITQVENPHWDEIFDLAGEKYSFQIIEDKYTYFNWKFSIDDSNGYQRVVCRPKSFGLENALHYSEYRSNHLDLAKYNSSRSDNGMIESDVAKKVIESIKVDDKINFNLLLQEMEPEIETYVQTHIHNIRQIVEESHLAIIQKSPEFESNSFPIISAWKCLFRLCFLRKLALDELSKEINLCYGLLTFVLTKQEIVQYFQEFGELDSRNATFASKMLIFKPDIDSVTSYDPYKQPLILLENNKILLLETYIQNSRILRNSLKLLTKQNKVQLDKCGHSMEIRFQKILQSNRFKTNEGQKVRILDSTKQDKTDLDVLAYREGVLFLGQVKNVLPPGNLYEIYRILEILEHAGDQLHACVNNPDLSMDRIKQLLGIKKDEAFSIEKVVGCILTNDITFGGYKIDDFLVFDIEGFDDILNYIEVDKPYPEALIKEFERNWEFHKTAYEKKMRYYEVKIGGIIFLYPGVPHAPMAIQQNTEV